MRVRLPIPQTLLGLVFLLVAGAPAGAHVPPPLYIIMELDEEALRAVLSFDAELYRDWVRAPQFEGPEAVESGPILGKTERFLEDAMKVEADGLLVRPVVKKVEPRAADVHGALHLYVDVTVEYGTKGRLRSLGLAWTRYANGIDVSVSPIDTELTAYGQSDYPVFTEKEPGYVWHAPRTPRERPRDVATATVEPETIEVPLVSAGLLLLLLVLVPVLLWRRIRWAVTLGAVGAGLLLAFLLRGVAPAAVRPPWAPGFQMPAAADAAHLFESLHRNIYRAFDYETEDAVYETLARSVEGDLLDEVYAEVYGSLILEDQGGAVCTIQKTEILENAIELPEDPEARAFHTVCRWRVRGKVGHWGHTHIRVNEYRARYHVRHGGGAWRIADVDILEQKRVER